MHHALHCKNANVRCYRQINHKVTAVFHYSIEIVIDILSLLELSVQKKIFKCIIDILINHFFS